MVYKKINIGDIFFIDVDDISYWTAVKYENTSLPLVGTFDDAAAEILEKYGFFNKPLLKVKYIGNGIFEEMITGEKIYCFGEFEDYTIDELYFDEKHCSSISEFFRIAKKIIEIGRNIVLVINSKSDVLKCTEELEERYSNQITDSADPIKNMMKDFKKGGLKSYKNAIECIKKEYLVMEENMKGFAAELLNNDSELVNHDNNTGSIKHT